MSKTNDKVKFNSKEPPPAPGWYPVNNFGTVMLRFWDGERFSLPVRETATAQEAAIGAQTKTTLALKFTPWAPQPKEWPKFARTARG